MSDRDSITSRYGRRRFIQSAAAAGTVASLGLAGCSETSDEDGSSGGSGGDSSQDSGTTTNGGSSVDEYVLGSHHPLTGVFGDDGQMLDEAIRMRAQMQNDAGGIEALDGATVRVSSQDNEGAQENGGPVVESLLEDGADSIIGCYTSPITIAAANTAQQNQVPMVVSVASSPEVLEGRGLDYVFRHQPPAPVQGRDYARWVPQIVRDAGYDFETVGLFHVNNEYGAATADGVEENAEANGFEVVDRLSYDSGTSNFNTQMQRMAELDPDAIAVTTYGAAGEPLINSLNNVGWFPRFLTGPGSTALSTDSILEQMGEDANGAFHCSFGMNTSHPDYEGLNERYMERTGNNLSSNPMMAYIAADLILRAVERAGSADNGAVQQALANTNIEDPLIANDGPLQFDEDGENVNAIAPVTQVQDLQSTVVYPEEFAEAAPNPRPHPKSN